MKTPSSNKKYLYIALLALVAGIAYSVLFKGGMPGLSNSGDRKGKRTIDMNATAKVMKGELIQRSTIAGTVTPNRKTIITAPYQGYVRKLYVKLGQVVKAGDPIASVSQTLVSGESVYPLRSPFAGQVVQVNKAEGEFVKASDATDFIARIDDESKMYVDSNVPELDRVKMVVGLEAIVKASAITDRTYHGVVKDLSLAATEQDRYGRSTAVEFPMRLEITDFDKQLHPGMSVIVDIVTLKKTDVLLLRHEFIGKEKDSYFVTLTNGKRVVVKLGAQNEEFSEIVEGVSAGTEVKKVDFSLEDDAG